MLLRSATIFLGQRKHVSSRRLWFDTKRILHVPELCDVEVAAILRKRLLAGELTLDRAADAVIDLVDLPLTRHGHLASVGRILQLRDNFSSYDATYVALAETLDAQLVTTDAGLARAVRSHLDIDVIDASGPR